MVDNNFYVMLEKEWFYSSEEQTLLQKYGTVGLMIYSIILRNLTMRNTFNFSISGICSLLKVDIKNNSAMVKNIKETIRKLNDNLFTVCHDSNCNISADITKIDNNRMYYGIRKDEPLKDKFIMIYDIEIDKMITYSKGKKNSLNELITHYIFIANGFHGKEKDGSEGEGYLCYYGGMEYIEQKTGIDNSTLAPNNKIFMEQKLLHIGNAGGSIEDNMYKNTSNIYCRYENKVEFDKFMKIKRAKLNSKFASQVDKEKQDEQRRLKQLINKYKKDNKLKGLERSDLSDKQFAELHELEVNYLNFVKSRDKEPVNPLFITIKQDGTAKELYIFTVEEQDNLTLPKDKGGLAKSKNKENVIPLVTPPLPDKVIKVNVKKNNPNTVVDFSEFQNIGHKEYIEENHEDHKDYEDYKLMNKKDAWMFPDRNKEEHSAPYSANKYDVNQVEILSKEQIKIDEEYKDNRIKEIITYTGSEYSNLSMNDKKKYQNKFGITKWLELNITEINNKYVEMQEFFNENKLTPQELAKKIFG